MTTLEIAYSRTRNQFILEDRLYQPSANLAPMIGGCRAEDLMILRNNDISR